MSRMKTGENPLIYMAREMWKYSEGNRRMVVLYLALSTIANLISLLEPVIFAMMLNTIQTQGITASSTNAIFWLIAALVTIEVGFWVFHGPSRVIETNNAFYARARYRKRMLEGTMSLPMKWHAEHHSGETIDRIEKGASSIYNFSQNSWQIIRIIVGFITAYIVLALFDINSAYIVGIITLLSFLIVLRLDRTLIIMYRKIFRAENEISAKVFDIISNIATVVILRLERLSSNMMYRKIIAPFSMHSSASKTNETKWFLVSILGAVMFAAVLISYILGSYAAGSAVLIGTVYIFYGYVGKIRESFFQFAASYSDLVRQKTAMQNANEISKEFGKKDMTRSFDLSMPWEKMKITGLSFHYHDAESNLHLNNVSLEIRNGEKIALVGESGGGKTTFLKLIRALYKPKHVLIEINGRKFKDFEPLAGNMTLLPQDPELFDATVKDNITMLRRASMKKIQKYAGIARFAKVAARLPKKYNSHIKERGVNLSTGEKQRLALARGLLAAEDSPIILLDEPTSSVDTVNEMAIYTNIFREFKDRTILSSVHRLHLLPMFDRIYVFRGGRLVASGSFGEIMKTKEFGRMWRKYRKARKQTIKN
ncbi:MAG: ABC transporter ATP-binding protein [Candidatus Aenigmarchaeota archaeon]|nr:ABC transporter ATP-binding protein [Candidatus Aenigmarchaeota archaeon]